MTPPTTNQARLAALTKAVKRPARARHVQGQMNKLETKYAHHLEMRKLAGAIRDYRFESMKFKLADKTYYTPDFLVIEADDSVTLIDVKGHHEDDARVKAKVAAKDFPWFRFQSMRWADGQWQVEDFPPYSEAS